MAPNPHSTEGGHQMRFESLFQPGRGMSFPCDAHGQVNMDELSERLRVNYLFARAMVGSEFAAPSVRATFAFIPAQHRGEAAHA
jgi:hypothetical protein